MENQLGLAGVLDDNRRGIADALRAIDAPAIYTGALVDAGDERFTVVVHDQENEVAPDRRRGGRADVIADRRVIADERAIPHEIARRVVAREIAGCEESVDALAI